MSLSLIMLRAGSADTIIARRLWCIRPSTPTIFHPRRASEHPGRRTLRWSCRRSSLQARRARDRGVPAGARAAEDRRRRSGAATARASRDRRRAMFLGRRSDAEVRDLYRGARVTLLPGEEDFGIVPLEAQACGRPVVALAAAARSKPSSRTKRACSWTSRSAAGVCRRRSAAR